MPELAREMLGWYLLKAGETEEGEAIFAAALAQRGNDSDLRRGHRLAAGQEQPPLVRLGEEVQALLRLSASFVREG